MMCRSGDLGEDGLEAKVKVGGDGESLAHRIQF